MRVATVGTVLEARSENRQDGTPVVKGQILIQGGDGAAFELVSFSAKPEHMGDVTAGKSQQLLLDVGMRRYDGREYFACTLLGVQEPGVRRAREAAAS